MAITKVSRGLLSTGVSDSSDATAITITSGENIGIGTDTPSQKLHVYNSTLQVGSKTGDTSIQQNTNAIRISAVPNSTTEWGGLQWYREFSDYIGAEIIASRAGTAESDTDLIFKTSTSSANATERMRITHGGLVGIGATSPVVMLDVRGEVAVDYNATYGLRFYNQSRNNWSSIGNPSTSSNADMVFKTGGGETLRLTHAKETLIGKSTTDFATAGIRFLSNGNANFTRDDGNVINVNRTNSNGSLIGFYQDGTEEGYINVSGTSVTLVGFSGAHESSGIAADTAIGTVCSTIDELDTYVSGIKEGQTRTNHAKIKVSDTEGDSRVFGVVNGYSEKDNKPILNSVGIGSVLVTGACEGGDLLESNGDGTAKVQDDDIIRSKTIGKVTIGNLDTNVKLVSCVLYCG